MPGVTGQGEAEPDWDSFVRIQVPHSFHGNMAAVKHRKVRACFPSWVPRGSRALDLQWKQPVSPSPPPSGPESGCMLLGRGWEDSLHPWTRREPRSSRAGMCSCGPPDTGRTR